jgi:N-ethylmaleimide reductase
LPVDAFVHTPNGKKPVPIPRALETREIPEIVEQFRVSAENAKEAGFDGVEIHGANSYLLDQFLRDGSNKRTDKYGGDEQNRARFPLEVAEAVARVWGGERVGYRISPHFSLNSMSDSNPRNTFTYLAKELDHLNIWYIHLVEAIGGRLGATAPAIRLAPAIRKIYNGTLMLNGGYDAITGNEAVGTGLADLVSFGVPFLANPDLPLRFKMNAPLNSADTATFYDGEEHGYTDYPALYRDIAGDDSR